MPETDAAELTAIWLYPIKSLDGVSVDEATIAPGGGLVGDRRWALLDGDGRAVNGKRFAALHRVRARFDLQAEAVTLSSRDAADPPGRRFSLRDEGDALAGWIQGVTGTAARLARNDVTGFPDDLRAPGPTVLGVSSLEAVSAWFAGLTAADTRRRFRANLEVGGVPPFWEDRLVGPAGTTVRFRIGEVVLEGSNPCQRCVVPSRDPETAAVWPAFARTFGDRRQATLPAWAERSRFDHFYRFAVNTVVAASETGKRLRVGDRVAIEGPAEPPVITCAP